MSAAARFGAYAALSLVLLLLLLKFCGEWTVMCPHQYARQAGSNGA